MDKPLKDALWDLLASEEASGCPDNRTLVDGEPIRIIRRYLGSQALPSVSMHRPWYLEAADDGTVHLVLTSPAVIAVANTLERGATGKQSLRVVAALITALLQVRATGD